MAWNSGDADSVFCERLLAAVANPDACYCLITEEDGNKEASSEENIPTTNLLQTGNARLFEKLLKTKFKLIAFADQQQ